MHDSIVKACVLFIVSLCFVTSPSAYGKVIYVDDDATGPGDGSSWTDAYRFLQDALADANDSVKPVEIRVAQGVYRPDQGLGVESGDREATFRLLNGVTIRGAYRGQGQPDPDAWNPSLYETILWGDLQDNDDFADTKTLYDNSDHIVTADGTDETAVLEGVTITRGAFIAPFYRNGPSEPQGGAGIHNRAGRPTIRHCIFSHNRIERARGAAMLNYEGAAPHLEQCTFQQNYGGSALCDHKSNSVLACCRIIENDGVGVWEQASQPQFEGCLFIGNVNAPLSLGDGSHATMSNCTFTRNYGPVTGASVQCTDCVVVENATRFGAGAVMITDGTFVRCTFRDNWTDTIGGAISAKSLTVEDSVFIGNWARSAGAISCEQADINGCLFAGNRSDHIAALQVRDKANITNCTIVNNRSMKWGVVDIHFAKTDVTNCIVRDNHCEDTAFGEIVYGDTTISFSCLEAPPSPTKGLGRTDVDPCFVDSGHWDPSGTPDDPSDDFFVEGDYHLKSQAGRWDPVSMSWVQDDVTSPCIDAGDPNSPIGLEPFPNGGRINMGAYGGTAEASKSYFGEPVCETVIAGDINGDCRVDFRDLQIMAGHWLEERRD